MNNPLVAQQQPLPPTQDPEMQKLLQELRDIDMEMQEQQAIMDQTSSPPSQAQLRSILTEPMPTLDALYNPDTYQSVQPNYDDTDDTNALGGATSYAELEAQYGKNPINQSMGNYGTFIPGEVLPAAAATGTTLIGERLLNPLSGSGSIYRQVVDNAEGKDKAAALTKKIEENTTPKGSPKKGKSDDVKKLLEDAGVTEEDIKNAEGSDRKEKMRNAIKSNYTKSLRQGGLFYGKFKGADAPDPDPDKPGFGKGRKIATGAGLTATLPAIYGAMEGLVNVSKSEDYKEALEKNRRAHQKTLESKLTSDRQAILEYLKGNPTVQERKQAEKHLSEVEDMLSGVK